MRKSNYINIILAMIYLVLEVLNASSSNLLEIMLHNNTPTLIIGNIIRIISMSSFLFILLGLLRDNKMAKLNSFYIIMPFTIAELMFSNDYIYISPMSIFEMIIYYVNHIFIIFIAIYLFLDLKDKKYKLNYLKWFILSLIFFIPLNIFEPLAFSLDKIEFLKFKIFNLWHIIFFILFILSAVIFYLFIKKSKEEERYEIIFGSSLILFYMLISRISFCRLNNYQTSIGILGAVPLYVCSFGTMLLPLAIYLKNKKFLNILFLVNMPGAIIVLVNPTTGITNIFHYDVVYFFVTHIALFTITLMIPIFLATKPNIKSLKSVAISLAIYFVVILFINLIVTNTTNIDPNFSFVSKSPLNVGVDKLMVVKVNKASFSVLYLFILYIVQFSLAAATYLFYRIYNNFYKKIKKVSCN